MPKIDWKDFRVRTAVFAAGAVIILFFLARSWIIAHKPKPPIPPRPVQTAVSFAKDADLYIDSFGNLIPLYDVNIVSQVTGEILEAGFTEGADVAKGDLLFTIDPRPFKAALDKALAQVDQDDADLKLKQLTLDRNTPLLKDSLVSQQDYDKYRTDVEAARAKKEFDVANLAIAKIDLGYCAITAPVGGRVGKRMVDPGNIVQADAGPVLVNIKTTDPLRLDFTIPEGDLPRVRDAMAAGSLTVRLTVPGEDTATYEGTVQFIDNTVDTTTGTVMARALVPNKEHRLWPGQFATVRLLLGAITNATQVPYAAVQLGQKGPYLFVVGADKKAELRYLTTGPRQGDDIVILKGVRPGETVVTAGYLGLSPGAAVVDLTAEKRAAGQTAEGKATPPPKE